MKKSILLFAIAAVAAIQSVSAQQKRPVAKSRYWFDLQVVQHFGLDKWNDAGYADDGFPPASMTEFRGVFNFTPFANPVFGLYADAGLGVMPAPKIGSFDTGRLPMPNSGTRYYLREMVSESGVDNASVHLRASVGIFGNFKMAGKLNIMPYLGAGLLTMPQRRYETVLKEDGSNMQYNALYVWGVDVSDADVADEYASGAGPAGFVTGRLNFKYRIKPALGLVFGLEYTYFISRMNFYGKYSNTFNGNVQRSFNAEGNNMNMLAVSAGISF